MRDPYRPSASRRSASDSRFHAASEKTVAMGLARPADVPARLLSAGQRQRTALARLKLQHRPVWLMDEPFSALDVDARARLENEVEVHCQGGGAVIAAIHGAPGFAASGEIML